MEEKRGPIEKNASGWPINPFGVVALLVFALIIIFLIAKPYFSKKTVTVLPEQLNSPGGQIISPKVGAIIKASSLDFEFRADNPSDIEKVQFWVKTYADGKWQMVGEAEVGNFKFEWQIPKEYTNKAVAVTTHIYKKDGSVIKDPGGWREGIILLAL